MYHGPEHFLDRDAAISRIMAHARLLMKLSRRFAAIAPPALSHSAHIANYKSGKIVIHADNGAVAVKIRQMGRRLCDDLSKGTVECNEIEVKVQPPQTHSQSATSTQKPISTKALDILGGRQNELPPGPLREALQTLIQRAVKGE